MDTRTGEIMSREDLFNKLGKKDFDKYARPVQYLSQIARKNLTRVGIHVVSKNSRCPCGSGKRFKKCCMEKI